MMAFIENIHFLRPLWLLALLPVLFLFIKVLNWHSQSSEWQTLIAPHLLPFLLEGKQSTSSKLPVILLLLIWLVLVLALAGPTWEKIPQPLTKDSSALVVLFDLSPSMNVEDVAPSRLIRARLKLIDLLDSRKEGLTALIAYAGESHVVTPLTDDVETIKNLIPSLSPNTMPVQGSNPEMAMAQANDLLRDAGIERGNVLFLTDGIAPSAFSELNKLQKKHGHKISVWGFGTATGAPIQMTEGGFARSRSGEIVIAKLDDEELTEAAMAMNGVYIPFTDTAEDIQNINHYAFDPLNSQQRKVEREFDQWVEFGPWLVLLCLPFVALSFRRGVLLSCVFILVLYQAPEAGAEEDKEESENVSSFWSDLWLTPDQQAQQALNEGKVEQAAKLFRSPDRKAAAKFRANEFEQAAELFEQSLDTDSTNEKADAGSWFNKGTALTHAGKYDDALAAYNKALSLQPEFPEAHNNKTVTEKLKALEEQQNQNQQNDQQNSQQDNQQNQEGQSEQQQQSDSASSESREQNQSDADSQNADSNSQQNEETEEQKAGQQDKADEEKAQQDFQKQLAEAQQKQDEEQAANETKQAAADDKKQDEQTQSQQALVDSDQEELTEEQQSLEQWLRRVPDDPGRLLRNKFRHETQQRQLEIDSSKWNTAENSGEQRW